METLQLVAIGCFGGEAILGALWFKLRNHRPTISTLMVAVLTLYVGFGLYSMNSDKGRAKSTPVIQADQSELALRVGSALNNFEQSLSTNATGKAQAPVRSPRTPQIPQTEKMFREFIRESRKVLDKSISADPTSGILQARRIVLLHELKEPIGSPLQELSNPSVTDGPALAKDLKFVYTDYREDGLTEQAVEEDVTKHVPAGWYRNQVFEQLYAVTNQQAKLSALKASESTRDKWLLAKFIAFVIFGICLFFIGAIIDLVQLIFLPRRMTPPEELELVRAPAAYGFKAVYAVFLCWMATEITIGLLASGAIRSLKLLQHGVLVAALATALIYLVSNGPGLLYAYFLAMKPHGIKFLEGFKFRTRVGNRGPGKLILTGVLSYIGAIPLVLIAYAIAMKVFGAQGSSNPIIALVMEAARSSNFAATLVFYFTVGVLAPVCEESLFRGFLYSSLRRKLGVLPSIVISAALFAAVHMDPNAFVALFTLGAIFAFVFEKTKSTLPGMIAHGLWNSGTFTLVLMLFGN